MARIVERPELWIGLQVLPATLFVAMGYPWFGAAAICAALVASTYTSWLVVSSARERQLAILSYARESVSMGIDPTPVVAVLGGRRPGEDTGSDGRAVPVREGEGPPPRWP